MMNLKAKGLPKLNEAPNLIHREDDYICVRTKGCLSRKISKFKNQLQLSFCSFQRLLDNTHWANTACNMLQIFTIVR